jgi:SulP family sulfate permease
MSGVRPEHESTLSALGVLGSLAHERHLFSSTPEAIAHARRHAAGGHPPEPGQDDRAWTSVSCR